MAELDWLATWDPVIEDETVWEESKDGDTKAEADLGDPELDTDEERDTEAKTDVDGDIDTQCVSVPTDEKDGLNVGYDALGLSETLAEFEIDPELDGDMDG